MTTLLWTLFACGLSLDLGSLGVEMRDGQRLLLARDLGFLDAKTHQRLPEQTTEVKRMLASFLGELLAVD